MALLTVFVPLINFFAILSLSSLAPVRHLIQPVLAGMVIVIAHLIAYWPQLLSGEVVSSGLGNWFTSGLFEVNWNFAFDSATYFSVFVVYIVSTLVHIYSMDYMDEDPNKAKFISYLSLFTFFMLLLVTSDNFVGLFLGWEGVGLCSYLLISFWSGRVQANKAAIQAMVVNRVADLALTVGMVATFDVFQSVEFASVFGLAPYFTESAIFFVFAYVSPIELVCVLLFLGAMGKSAQIGLHIWLPNAMEGPTPVSALIHAATMVTAGVFLLVRCSPIFELAPLTLSFVTLAGLFTAFMAGTVGLVQHDIKKVIAYSTCSQLGYMICACGLSYYSLGFFHLVNHAFFKALLFLSAGVIIHALGNDQDMRKYGSLRELLPFTFVMVMIGSSALDATTYLSGYYSKDPIIELLDEYFSAQGVGLHLVAVLAALCTSTYSARLLSSVFSGDALAPRSYLIQTRDASPAMVFVLSVLAVGSIFSGYLGRDLFIGLGTSFWNGAVVTSWGGDAYFAISEFSDFTGAFAAALLGSVGALNFVSCYWLTRKEKKAKTPVPASRLARELNLIPVRLYRFLSYKWYFDAAYNRKINGPFLRFAYDYVFGAIDKTLLEFVGPYGLGALTFQASTVLARFQTGQMRHYAIFMLLAAFITVLLLQINASVLSCVLLMRKKQRVLDIFASVTNKSFQIPAFYWTKKQAT